MTNYCTPSHLSIPPILLFDIPKLDRWDDKPSGCCLVIECSREEAVELYRTTKQHTRGSLPDAKHGLHAAALLDSNNIK